MLPRRLLNLLMSCLVMNLGVVSFLLGCRFSSTATGKDNLENRKREDLEKLIITRKINGKRQIGLRRQKYLDGKSAWFDIKRQNLTETERIEQDGET